MEIKIRPYKIDDCPFILDIINDQILNGTALYDYHSRTLEQQIAIFQEKLQKDFLSYYCYMIANEVVGFGYYSEFRFREAYKFTVEHSVYAHKKAIGKGVGKAFLQN